MSTQPFDPIRYKAGQQREWERAAVGWKNWWQTIELGLQPVSDRMMDLAEIRPGQHVLDVATGIGEPAVTAARLVGPVGQVTAIDISAPMLDIARARAIELGLHNITFRVMDAEKLDLPEQSFDVILSRLGLMYLPNLQTSLEKMRKLLVPGGHLTAAVWGHAQKVPFVSMPMGVAMRTLQVSPPPAGMPGPFSLADTDHVVHLLTQAGFTRIHTEPMALISEWTSSNEYVRFLQEVLVQMNTLLANYPVERRAEVWQAIAEAAQQFIMPDGSCRTENELLLVAGQR